MDGGVPALTVDEIPLEWCYQPGVKLDFRHFDDSYVVKWRIGSSKGELMVGFSMTTWLIPACPRSA